MKGIFITFEGTEGSGKTTIINNLIKELKSNNYDAISTREPGGVDISEQIRNVILNVDNTKMDKVTEALLYAASRRQQDRKSTRLNSSHVRISYAVFCM